MDSFRSILFPYHDAVAVEALRAPECFADLHLDQIVKSVTAGHADQDLQNLFWAPLHDVATVGYRHDVFRDLDNAEIRVPVDNFVTAMRTVRQHLHQATHLYHPLQRQGWFVYAVDAYCHALVTLHAGLTGATLASAGLKGFADHVSRYTHTTQFQNLAADNQAVQEELRRVRYAVHIDGLRVDVAKFSGDTDYSADIAATFARFATEATTDYHVRLANFTDMDHIEEQILERVAKLFPEPFALLDDFCTRNADFTESVISRFEREIHFYLSYLDFMHRLIPSGVAFSYPDVTTEAGVAWVDDAVDLALAAKSVAEGTHLVGNSFHLCGSERIFVVTGPNQGGKTTFARTVGQCAYLAALGCPISGTGAALTLPDAIYTHFERQESLTTLHGKLDDELVRIHDILSRATATSLIVMNESFASTTVNDALLIGTEVLRRIVELGCTTVYVTFLDELASIDPACVSMVGGVDPDDPTQRTFVFTHRPADGLAYAAALARKYGLTQAVLRRRIAQ